jgi:4-hydroxybenzoate polyprenyltransferase
VAAVILLLVGIVLLPIRPLVGFIVLSAGVTVVLDHRGLFGRGMFRAAISFIAGIWLGLAGVVGTLLGMFALPGSCDATTTTCEGPEGNFLFLPGVLLLVLGLGLLAGSVAAAIRARRRRQPWPTE